LGKSFTDNVIGGVAADMSLVASEISIVSFSSSARLRFDQGSSGPFGTAADAQAFIPSITQGGGGTCTRCGIDLCASTLNTGAQYGKVMIVLTDGYGGSVSDSRDAAKAQGITISAVGVGSGVDLTSLQDTATDNQLVFQVDDFNALANVVDAIVQAAKTTCTPVTR
jgi:collagen type VI alpha